MLRVIHVCSLGTELSKYFTLAAPFHINLLKKKSHCNFHAIELHVPLGRTNILNFVGSPP